MKIAKNLLTLVLAALMLLSLAVPAMADDDFRIDEDSCLFYYNGPGGNVVIPDGVVYIGADAFSDSTGVTSVTIPEGVIEIWAYAFYECTDLKSVTIPESVTEICQSAFSGCTSLTDVKIPSGVTVIPICGFYQCSSLKSITIPEGVTEIEDYAFWGCTGLKTVTIPSSVTGIYESFAGCTGVTDVYFGGTKEQWESIEKENGGAIFGDSPKATIHFNSTGSTTPTTPTTPEPAKSESAMPTNDQLTVNGALQSPTVYKIGGSNFFKIRDLAAMLNGTEKQFDVGYDGTLKSVTLTAGKGYAKQAGDMAGAATGGNQSATPSNDSIYIDGQKIDVTVYKIGGSNFFMLRDLGRALDFYVGWTREDGVFIDTSKPYSD